ncbi:DUF222 domain-containing protein [Kribbella sp. NPDC056345]|uniref:DUF222 domain-containing protein n=1 Tax=Kribbella sp. NPDC056345 TaxID=3345789 RepID=UPI0035DE862F
MEALDERPVWSMSGSEKLAELDGLDAEFARLQTRWLELVGSLDETGYAEELGARDVVELLTRRYRLDRAQVSRDRRLARALPKYAAVAGGLADGIELPPPDPDSTEDVAAGDDVAVRLMRSEQAWAIVSELERIRSRVPVEVLDVAEAELVKLAARLPLAELRKSAREICDVVDVDGPEPDESKAYERESLTLVNAPQGVKFRGYLANENAEALRSAVVTGARPHKTPNGDPDPRPREKRQADALSAALAIAAAATDAGLPRPPAPTPHNEPPTASTTAAPAGAGAGAGAKVPPKPDGNFAAPDANAEAASNFASTNATPDAPGDLPSTHTAPRAAGGLPNAHLNAEADGDFAGADMHAEADGDFASAHADAETAGDFAGAHADAEADGDFAGADMHAEAGDDFASAHVDAETAGDFAGADVDAEAAGDVDGGGEAAAGADSVGVDAPAESVALPGLEETAVLAGFSSGARPAGSVASAGSRGAGWVPGFGAKANITVTIDFEDLKAATANATGGLVYGDRLSAATIRRLACDAKIIPLVLGSKSEPLDVGRAERLITRGMRRALNHRDKGCVVCGAPPVMCDAHHLTSWIDGGPTAIHNLVLLCRRHHSDLHLGHWKITIVDGEVRVSQPAWATPPPHQKSPHPRPPTPTDDRDHPHVIRTQATATPSQPATRPATRPGRWSANAVQLSEAATFAIWPGREHQTPGPVLR